MGMVVRTNMAALNANNSLAQASKAQQNGMQKLASGFKINAAKDDASGLAITEKMKNQIKALDTAKDNCEDGANMIQTAEGYMKETHDILTRMTELAEKAANGLLKDEDRGALQNEMDQLCGEIDRMASTANFNGVKLLNGDLGSKNAVKLECDKNGFKVIAPTISGNDVGGGKISSMNGTPAAPANTSGTYQVRTVTANTSDLKSVTITADELDAGTVSTTNTNKSFTINVQKGDKVTVGSTYTGAANAGGNVEFATTDNGLKLTGTDLAKFKGASFTFDGNDWVSDADSTVKLQAGTNLKITADVTAQSTAGTYDSSATTFTYDAAADEMNDKNLESNGIDLQIGESSTAADRLKVSINSFHTDALFSKLDGMKNTSIDSDNTDTTATVKINKGNKSSTYDDAVTINIKNEESASAAADAIRAISSYVSDERGKLGAQQNRLEHTVNNLTTASENTTAAKSRILDTDMAKEMMAYTSKNVIAQAAQSMLAQANSQPQNVLSLLQ